jgi:Hydrazine synthase alpha subunit middle domain
VPPRSILACALLLISAAPATPTNTPTETAPIPEFIYTAAKNYDPLAWQHGGERFSSGAEIFIREGNSEHPLIPDFAATADPAVSFDAQKILFAGKHQANDPWQIWEITLEGKKVRHVTAGKDDCIRPFYLPDDRIVYARKLDGRFVIEAANFRGDKPLALTYINANAIPADILRDGRILFESGFPLGTDGPPEIYTVYSDGSGIESYRCDHATARHGSRQANSGDIIFVSAHGLTRFTSARAQQVSITSPQGEYAGDLAEISTGEWILSWRPSRSTSFQLVRWKSGSSALTPLLARSTTNLIQPTVIAQRAVPNRHPSGLHDWPNANLLCLNAYTSKYQFAPGSIESVRFYTRGSDGSPKLLGTAPVERDGSFFAQVPNDQPLQIELLDAAGKMLRRESGFFWMRRGEQRGCVGCHAGPETAPENSVPMALLKSTTPANMTGSAAQSAGGH